MILGALVLLLAGHAVTSHEKCVTILGVPGSCVLPTTCFNFFLHSSASLLPSSRKDKLPPKCCENKQYPRIRICCPGYYNMSDTSQASNVNSVNSQSAIQRAASSAVTPAAPSSNATSLPDSTVSTNKSLPHPIMDLIHTLGDDDTQEIVIPPGVSKLVPGIVTLLHPKISLLPLDTCGSSTVDFIWHGKNAALGQFPWNALICYTIDDFPTELCVCGASVISKRYLLTAAHCIARLPRTLKIKSVRLGEYDKKTDPDCDASGHCMPKKFEVGVEKSICHPNYGKPHNLNDIGLIRLSRDVDISTDHVRAVCLPLDSIQCKNLELVPKLIVSGWGKTEKGNLSEVLRFVGLATMSRARCQLGYIGRRIIQPSQMCVGGGKEDSCVGDSGGPLTMIDTVPWASSPRVVQVGIVSFGPTMCGTPGRSGIYTKLCYFTDWILDNMEP